MYHRVVLGGTFDRLHKGHAALLAKAFAVGERVTIGLTTDEYVRNVKCSCKAGSRFARQMTNDPPSSRLRRAGKSNSKSKKAEIASYIVRKKWLEEWLGKQGWNGRYAIVPLNDSYGPTLTDASDFDAIVVSSETRKTAEEINVLRKEKGLEVLRIVEIPMVPAEDLQTISSTRVRKGEIDVTGRLVLPDSLRRELRKVIGEHIPDTAIERILKQDANRILVTVGDMTTKRIFDFGIRPNLAIIDFQMERKPFFWEKETLAKLTEKSEITSFHSGPGYISVEALHALHAWARTFKGQTLKGTVFFVDGEEDLLVLPVILEAPIGSVVLYGQPKRGIIQVKVTEGKKLVAKNLLNKFVHTV